MISPSPALAGGKRASALPARETDQPRLNFPSYRAEQGPKLPLEEVAPAAPTVADVSLKLAAARQAAYPGPAVGEKNRSLALTILLVGLIVFALLFIAGYFAGQFLFHP